MLQTTIAPSGDKHHHSYQGPIRTSVARPLDSNSILARYLDGWAKADPAKIVDATAEGYDFYDPLVGHFSRSTLTQYFAFLRSRFATAGVTSVRDLVFALRGPMLIGKPYMVRLAPSHSAWGQYWREAPLLGLTGLSEIVATHHGVAAEAVAYDLNMACETLRGDDSKRSLTSA